MEIEGNSIAECWLKALAVMVDEKVDEISPLILRIFATEEEVAYRGELEKDINMFLASIEQPSIETTAGTIFPYSLSNGRDSIFDRFDRIWKHVAKNRKNNRGTYFRRLMAYGDGYIEPVNQLEHILSTYNGEEGARSSVHRRSALIATVFDPSLDHSYQPQQGFPCLQQVCFVPKGDKLKMNAVYAMQHLSTRAYGNYLGLMRLGKYMADNMGLEFVELHCMLSVLGLGKMKKSQAKELVDKYR